MTSISTTDGFKVLIAATNGFITFLVIAVLFTYTGMVRKGYRGFLSYHIGFAAMFVIMSCSYVTYDALDRMGKEITPRVVFAVLMVGTGLPAVLEVLKHLQKTKKRLGL